MQQADYTPFTSLITITEKAQTEIRAIFGREKQDADGVVRFEVEQ